MQIKLLRSRETLSFHLATHDVLIITRASNETPSITKSSAIQLEPCSGISRCKVRLMPKNRCDDELLMSCGIGPLWLGDDVVARTHCAVERRRPKSGLMYAAAGLLVHMVWLATDIDWRIRIACSCASAVVTQCKGLRMR
jgi:hypothetical protein